MELCPAPISPSPLALSSTENVWEEGKEQRVLKREKKKVLKGKKKSLRKSLRKWIEIGDLG